MIKRGRFKHQKRKSVKPLKISYILKISSFLINIPLTAMEGGLHD